MINPLSLVPSVPVAMANPMAGTDQEIAAWFHSHLNHALVSVLRALSEPGSATWIGIVLAFLVGFFIWKRYWVSLVTLVAAVPGGMLLNELIKVEVQRSRPFATGWFVDWSGYSFASGHTIGATLLYGQLALFLLPKLKSRFGRGLTIGAAILLVMLVGFSRVALGAHYFTDVLSAIVIGALWLTFCVFAAKPMRRPAFPQPLTALVAPAHGELNLLATKPAKPAVQKIIG